MKVRDYDIAVEVFGSVFEEAVMLLVEKCLLWLNLNYVTSLSWIVPTIMFHFKQSVYCLH